MVATYSKLVVEGKDVSGNLSDILADTGLNLEESASKTKQVAGEISETISEISKGT